MSYAKFVDAVRMFFLAVLTGLIFWAGTSIDSQGKAIVRLEEKVVSLKDDLNRISAEIATFRFRYSNTTLEAEE